MSEPNSIHQDTVTGLASNANHTYAAKASGLYQSDDAGQSWQLITDESQTAGSSVTALSVMGETIFAGLNGGILRTEDNTNSWSVIALAAPPPLVSSIVMSPNYVEDGTAFAGTAEDGVFVTTNHGENWIPWNFGLIDLDIYCLSLPPNFANDKTIYAGTETGIFCSHNIGKSWHDLPFPMESAPVLSIALTDGGQIFAGTDGNGLFVSDDSGQSWSIMPAVDSAIIHSIRIVDSHIFVLTDQHLLEIHPSDMTPTTLNTFNKTQPIALGKAGDRWLVGHFDGQIDVI